MERRTSVYNLFLIQSYHEHLPCVRPHSQQSVISILQHIKKINGKQKRLQQ